MSENLFTYDLTNRIITDNSFRDYAPENAIKYSLGQIFVNFINYDFSFYDSERKKLDKLLKQIDYIYYRNSNLDESLRSVFPCVQDKYYELSHDDSMGAIVEYLLDIPHIIPYCNSNMFTDYKQFAEHQALDFVFLQNEIKKYVFCLDMDCQPEITSLQKYVSTEDLSFSMHDGILQKEKTIIRHKYSWEEHVNYEIETYANTVPFIPNSEPDSSVLTLGIENNPNWRNTEIEIIHGYVFETPKEALQCEFLKMLELGIKIRKCTVCGKYFIVTGHNGNCCDNLYKDTGLTCQQVFADRNYKNKRKQNPILKEYDKAYKRMYARYSNKKNLASDEYTKWKNEAARERDKALEAYTKNPSEAVINNFKQFLHNK